jgi:glycerol uptake facilitator-like aquaporin
MQLFYGIKYDDWQPISTYWIYFLGPIAGAIFSAIFFNYFFLPLFIRWKAKK